MRAGIRRGVFPALMVASAVLVGCEGNLPTTGSKDPKEAEVTKEQVARMLATSDPKLCAATSDASYVDIAMTYGRVAVLAGSEALMTSQSESDLQQKLNEVRPALRDMSRKTAWLPIPAERLIGDQIYRTNKLEVYQPPRRQQVIVDQTMRPIFNALKSYAKDELKSSFDFDMRIVRDDDGRTPSMIAGGIMLVPSGMLNTVSSVKSPEPMIAFMMAHEFSHALRRHYTKKIQLTIIEGMTEASEFKKIANTKSGLFKGGGDFQQLFSFNADNVKPLVDKACKARNWTPLVEQKQEFEADVCGALLLKKLSGATGKTYSAVEGYVQYVGSSLSTVPDKEKEGECMVEVGHPHPQERLDNLKQYTQTIGAKGS